MENNICFLIPIYPPHYNYLKFIEDLSEYHEFTIIFIFTYIDDYNIFKNLNVYKNSKFKNFDFIILEENILIKPYICNFNHRDKGIINIKKFYGLYFIINNKKYNFHYIACVDSEIRFINLNNLYKKFQLYCKRKIAICGNTSIKPQKLNFLNYIHNECFKFIKLKDRNRLLELTNNGNYYFWYSDIHIYDVTLLPNFFKYINFDYNNFDNFIKQMNFWTFEYIIYYYYCMIYYDYKLLCMEDYNIERHWSMEAAPYEIFNEVKIKMNYETNSVIGNCYYKNIEKFNDSLPVLVYNLNNPRYNKIYNKIIDYLDN